jgi:hypothetical protein
MSSQSKFFIQKNIDPKEGNISGITAVNINDRYLITGNGDGILTTYQYGQDKLSKIQDYNFKSKIEKILVPSNPKAAFILAGTEVHYVQIPLMKEISNLFKKEQPVYGVFLNNDDPNCKNMILIMIMVKKKRALKLYQYEIVQEKITIQEKKK